MLVVVDFSLELFPTSSSDHFNFICKSEDLHSRKSDKMDKKKWLWKRRSSDKSPSETESPGSSSSSSERYSDEQHRTSQQSPKDNTQSPEVASKASITDDQVQETVKNLNQKLSAALVNVSAKENLVKQHAKVAEEAVAGWEEAENEVAILKQQLEAKTQQNLSMEVRMSHLDSALKECVRQLRQARDEQEKMISDAVAEKSREWETIKAELENRILVLQTEAEAARTENHTSIIHMLEKENLFLKQEMETLKIERDLSIQTAEAASKLQLESQIRVTKLEAECRRLRKSNPKAVVASCFYAESLTDTHSDSGENLGLDSWASALIAELDQFKSENKPLHKIEIEMMDDFLEMEHLAALPDTKSNTPVTGSESGSEMDSMIQRSAELEKKLVKIEAEKVELETALDEKQHSLEVAEYRIAEAETKLQDMQKERSRTDRECETQKNTNTDGGKQVKQEGLAVAADKLLECQKTIASLGKQLKSLATLEDFLIDTASIPGFSTGSMVSGNDGSCKNIEGLC